MSTTEKKAPRDKSAWGKKKFHDVTLPSGFEVTMQIPNMPELIKTGQIPNHLIDAAIGAIESDKVTKEMIQQQAEFYNQLVVIAVTDPVITAEDVLEIPYEDVELIVEIATRQRDIDAVGHQIAGLHKSADWRAFRELDHRYSDVAGL